MVIRIGIVEDDTLLRTSLAQSLMEPEREIVFSVGSAREAIRELSEVDVDVLIADIHLGSELSGADVARVAEEHNPDIGVVYLTSFEDPRLAHGGAPVLLVKNSVDPSPSPSAHGAPAPPFRDEGMAGGPDRRALLDHPGAVHRRWSHLVLRRMGQRMRCPT